jgi:dTDP-4-dehydrorhamnose 3,5-epimerase
MSVFEGTDIPGVRLIEKFSSSDQRGNFSKILAKEVNENPCPLRQLFWSVSNHGVVRGMHVSLPPTDGWKLVSVIHGEILDVQIDLREGLGYGRVNSLVMTSESNSILIPPSVGHGFQVVSTNQACVIYATSNGFDRTLDSGVNPLSFGFEWPIKELTMSVRDKNLPTLEDFTTSETQ